MSTRQPNQIEILGKTVKILYVKKVDTINSMGECDGSSRVIKIKDGLSEELTHETLMHEIIHMILYLSGQSEHMTSEFEEGVVLALETGLSGLKGFKLDKIKV